MTREKWSAIALILIALAMIVGGCTRSDEHKSHEHKAAAKPTASVTPTATATTPSTGTTKPPGVPTCQAAQLKVKLAEDPGGGAAGSTYSHLTFTNTGATTCVMTGWPGVSYVDNNGTQIGSPADRTGSPTVVSLKSGAVADAPLKEAAAGNFDADCIITPADGLRVYSPNTKVAVFVAHTVEACAAPSKHLMTIGPVRLK
jgi:hypothetical protein